MTHLLLKSNGEELWYGREVPWTSKVVKHGNSRDIERERILGIVSAAGYYGDTSWSGFEKSATFDSERPPSRLAGIFPRTYYHTFRILLRHLPHGGLFYLLRAGSIEFSFTS